MGKTWEVARKEEKDFFRRQLMKESWGSVEAGYRQRLGSEALAEYLSKILSDLVAQRWVSELLLTRLSLLTACQQSPRSPSRRCSTTARGR